MKSLLRNSVKPRSAVGVAPLTTFGSLQKKDTPTSGVSPV
jgi:hypothetical protein